MSRYDITDGASFAQAMAAISKKLNVKVEQVNENVTREVTDCALDCISRSVPRTPIESGFLRSTAYAEINGKPIARGEPEGAQKIGTYPEAVDRVEAEVGYGAKYAHRQHEDLNMRHDRTDGYRRKDGTTVNMVAGGQAKYLESVVVENIDAWGKRIKDAAKRGIEE